MSECPVCHKAVDPLRARAVGVRDGKVVAYCSLEHKQQAEAGGAEVKVTVRTPAKGTPVVAPALDSGPVIEIIREPSAPVVAVPKQDSKPVRAKSEPGDIRGSANAHGVVSKSDVTSGEVVEAKPKAGRAERESDTSAKVEVEAKRKSEPKLAAPAIEAKSTRDDATKPDKKSSPKIETKPEAKSERSRTPGGGTRLPTAPIQPPPDYDDDDLGPPAEDSKPRSNKPLIVIALLVVAAIAAAFIVKSMRDGKNQGTKPPPPPPAAKTPEAPPPPAPKPAPVTRESAYGKARDLLVAQMASDSPRVQQRAAEALARMGDKQAIDVLLRFLAKETSNEIARVDLAYAIARGGDKRGTDALIAALGSRRDVRAEAANRLALLRDERAIPVLADYLDVPQLRMGAAEHLAHLAEPRAIKVLDATRTDDKASPDDKARATVALAFAGRTDIAAALHDLLGVTNWKGPAAEALAHLHDAAARPVLVEQLGSAQLRVDAAVALRELDPKLDPMPMLPPLLADLASAKDTAQIDTAEAILILTAPTK